MLQLSPSRIRHCNGAICAATILVLLLLSGLNVSAGGAAEGPPPAARESGPGPTADEGLQPLRIGLMPAVDSIPLIVAEAAGFLVDEGLSVELEVFRDQLQREASLQAGVIDGAISDLVNAIRAWENGADYRVIAGTQGRFAILASSESGIRSLEDWPEAPETVETGVIEDSIIFYTAQRMLSALGADPARIRIVPSLQIPVRLELLGTGALEAAVLPEPLTQVAIAAGAVELVSSDVLPETPGILIATGPALADKPNELAALLRAWNRAVALVNEDPDAWRDVIVSRAGLPPPTARTMRIPDLRPAELPADALVADVARWMLERGLIASVPDPSAIVQAIGPVAGR